MTVANTLITVPLLILSTVSTVPAHAAQHESKTAEPIVTTSEIQTIEAAANANVAFERESVSSVAAPQPVAEVPVASIQPVTTNHSEVVPTATPTKAPAQAQAPQPAAPAPAIAQIAPSGSGVRAAIVSAAYAQLGVPQDCTMLVTNSLAAVGIHFHGWPADYISLGHIVPASEAQPGDLAYYANGGMGEAHIAVYVGNGMAVHGGWNGNSTVLFSVNVGSGPVFIRVG
jgi:cell wall-associated NlpC family hydrolase